MTEPNLNTFAPSPSVNPARENDVPSFCPGDHIVVIGAGAFGGWSALYLLRRGFKVTMIDAWGPGNSRSSSGDETRVIRSTYGNNETYFDLNVRALELWKENQRHFERKIFYNTGVLWFCYNEQTPLVDNSFPFALKHKMEYEYLTPVNINRRYPVINTRDLHHAFLDPYGGYLKAREATQSVHEAFLKEGGLYVQSHVTPFSGTTLSDLLLPNGSKVKGDAYLFACGSWMGQLFPGILKNIITCTKQEVYYFGTPLERSSAFEDLPAWIDVDGESFYYGIPGNAHRGFKIGVDVRGESFDPTHGERTLTHSALKNAREFIGHRFPKLKDAPLLEHRVCPYENSPDGNFIFGLLPESENIFLLGGGSGHGFKHGPALGELVSDVISGNKRIPELFTLIK